MSKAATGCNSEHTPVLPDRVTVRAIAVSQDELQQIEGGGSLPTGMRRELLAGESVTGASTSRDLLRAHACNALPGAAATQSPNESTSLGGSNSLGSTGGVVGDASHDEVPQQSQKQARVPKYLQLVGLQAVSISLCDSSSHSQWQVHSFHHLYHRTASLSMHIHC